MSHRKGHHDYSTNNSVGRILHTTNSVDRILHTTNSVDRIPHTDRTSSTFVSRVPTIDTSLNRIPGIVTSVRMPDTDSSVRVSNIDTSFQVPNYIDSSVRRVFISADTPDEINANRILFNNMSRKNYDAMIAYDHAYPSVNDEFFTNFNDASNAVGATTFYNQAIDPNTLDPYAVDPYSVDPYALDAYGERISKQRPMIVMDGVATPQEINEIEGFYGANAWKKYPWKRYVHRSDF